jgi:hypothetical protein
METVLIYFLKGRRVNIDTIKLGLLHADGNSR